MPILLTLLTLGQELVACEWARQSRIFPIGMVGDELVAVNFRLKRDWRAPEGMTQTHEWWWWQGTARLVSINPSTYQVTHVFESLELASYHPNFQHDLDSLYRKLLATGRKLEGIKLFKPTSFEYYGFEGSPPLRFVVDEGDTSARLVDAEGNSMQIPSWDYADTVNILHYPNALTLEQYQTPELELNIPRYFTVGTIRYYELDSTSLVVIHAACGNLQDEIGEPLPVYHSTPEFDKLDNCAYEEAIPWHGIGQDIIVSLKIELVPFNFR